MSEIVAKAASDDVGLRRESTLDVGGLPLWLARLHRALPVDATVKVSVQGELPVPIELLFEGAGFIDEGDKLLRTRTLPDYLVPGMKTVIIGLNPSLRSADAGYGFAGPGNRFWTAAAEAGLLSSLHQPEHALTHESVGFTDLVKRASKRANELTTAEFRAGLVRIDHVLGWLKPKIVIMAGIGGWRLATGTKQRTGWQDVRLGDRPVYLMPNPSGLNTSASLEQLVEHLQQALAGPPATISS